MELAEEVKPTEVLVEGPGEVVDMELAEEVEIEEELVEGPGEVVDMELAEEVEPTEVLDEVPGEVVDMELAEEVRIREELVEPVVVDEKFTFTVDPENVINDVIADEPIVLSKDEMVELKSPHD